MLVGKMIKMDKKLEKEYKELITKIKYLLQNNIVPVLTHSGSAWQNDFISSLAASFAVCDLADPAVRQRALWQPSEFVRGFARPFMLLNLQCAPQLLEYLCSDVRKAPCLAVSSQCYYIKEAMSSLQGVQILELPLNVTAMRQPFLPAAEQMQNFVKGKAANNNVFERIINGDAAESVFADNASREAFYAGYVQHLLQYEIKSLTTVSDEMKFYRFMCAAAASIGNVVNYAALGNGADISSPTAKQWLAFLEGAGIVSLLQPVEAAGVKRLAKAPKLYFTDTGLACYLLRLVSAADAAASTFANNLFENWVYMQIKNSWLQNGLIPDFAYYRDSNAKEISILIKQGGVLYPVELRREPLPVKKLQKKLALLGVLERQGGLKLGSACMVSMGVKSEQLDENLWLVAAGQL